MSILRDELTNDPGERGYAGMSDEEATTDLNTARITEIYQRFITVRTLMAEVGASTAHTIMVALETAAEGNAVLARALGFMTEYAEGGGIDIGHTNTRNFVDTMIAGGVLTQDQGDDLKGLGERLITRAQQLGLSGVKEGHVRRARSQ